MKRHLCAACALVVIGLFALVPSSALTPPHPSIEAYGNLPAISDVSISPDGKHMAAIQSYQGRPVAVIYNLTALDSAPVAIPATKGFIVGVDWANNERLLVTVNMNDNYLSWRVHGWFRTVSYDVNGQNPVVLLNNLEDLDANTSGSGIVDSPPEDPAHVYMEIWMQYSQNVWHIGLYKVDVFTGKTEKIMVGGEDTVSFVMDGHGKVIARIDESKDPRVDHLLVYENGKWREIAKYNAQEEVGLDLTGLSADGQSIMRLKNDETTGMLGMVAVSLADGSEKPVYFDPQFDLGAVLIDDYTSRVVGYAILTDMVEFHYFDAEMDGVQKGIEAAFHAVSAHAVSWDASRQKVIVAVDRPGRPRAYYLLDRTTHQAHFIASTYPDLPDAALGEVRFYQYAARDGTPIPAYLTLPPGKPEQSLPVVIMPHGGPTSRDSMAFDWLTQFLANRGYAVLQPNFRGSNGYGKKFEAAGYGQWGLRMQDDVTDGVRKLIADGTADPKRICIMGASYGGYAALAGAAFTPDLYACAIAWAPVTDLRLLLKDTQTEFGKKSDMVRIASRYIGKRSDDADKLDAASPALHADAIHCPVLLMHGVKDSTVRINQSEEMNSALESAHKKVTFIKIKEETHYMQAAASRIRFLTEMEKFLKEAIGN